ncbi:MAG: aldehyde dehydrogenase family protein [Candidatus Heimdallarchaeota archaeon]|nr:aldehyde dehydrogenase family protein [Candidatus Heimdallarchaeota archaeon]MCK4609526.1 aldehyde dehydrogenase family protein [Candidatus Heimdallarchaeota archaeon]
MKDMAISTLPLLKNGEEYLSQSKKTIKGIHDENLLEVSIAPEILVQIALPINKGSFHHLQSMPIDDIISIYSEAGKIFMDDMLINGVSTSVDEWSELITLSTGMPIRFVRNALNLIPHIFRKSELKKILRANSPTGNLGIYDNFVDVRGGTRFGWTPRGKNVGIALPGNHPAVSLLGTLIPLFKIPALIRASSSEPFTSFRICKALWEAGLPPETLFHFTTDHSVVDTIVRKSDLGIIFGNEWILKAYEHDSRIKTYGPGRSKVLVEIENMTPSLLDLSVELAYQSINYDTGRGCINASGIIYNSPDNYEEFRDKLAEKLASLEPLDPMDPKAEISAMNPDAARGLHKFIQSRMDTSVKDITAKFRNKEGFLHIDGELAFFMPTLLELGEEHQMRTDEYPFAFGTICKPDDYYADELVSDSLSLSYLSDNPQKAKRLLNDPSIHKLFVNDQTFTMQVSAPHEGFQADFLYGAKASNYDGINNLLK